MNYYDYQSELYPIILDTDGFDWFKSILLNLPTDKLEDEYRNRVETLETLRQAEPAKKRGQKQKYRFWIQTTHDYRDELNNIAAELRRRKTTRTEAEP